MELRTGIITKEELVNMFGTQKQIEKYNAGKLTSRTIETIMRKASLKCQIEKKKTRERGLHYVIRKIYSIEQLSDEIKKEPYCIIIPLIINRLIESDLPKSQTAIAKSIGLIDDSYRTGRTKENVHRIDRFVTYYIDKAINYINNIIIYKDIYYGTYTEPERYWNPYFKAYKIRFKKVKMRLNKEDYELYKQMEKEIDDTTKLAKLYYERTRVINVYKETMLHIEDIDKAKKIIRKFGKSKEETLRRRMQKWFNEIVNN